MSADSFAEHATFFTEVPHRIGRVETDPGSVFDPQGSALCSVMRFVGQLPATASEAQRQALQALYRHHRSFLEPAIELSAAWIGKFHAYDPESWLGEELWGQPLAQMPQPFYGFAPFAEYRFQQNLRGIDLPLVLHRSLAGGAGSSSLEVGSFRSFVTDLGNQTRVRIARFDGDVQTFHVVFNYRPVRDGAGNWMLQSTADLYFLTLSKGNSTLYSSCASAEVVALDFSYRKGTLTLDGGALDAEHNIAMRDSWRSLLDRSISTPLDQARLRFETTITAAG